jgi:F0F1-type ATP synthase assembly protein I
MTVHGSVMGNGTVRYYPGSLHGVCMCFGYFCFHYTIKRLIGLIILFFLGDDASFNEVVWKGSKLIANETFFS